MEDDPVASFAALLFLIGIFGTMVIWSNTGDKKR